MRIDLPQARLLLASPCLGCLCPGLAEPHLAHLSPMMLSALLTSNQVASSALSHRLWLSAAGTPACMPVSSLKPHATQVPKELSWAGFSLAVPSATESDLVTKRAQLHTPLKSSLHSTAPEFPSSEFSQPVVHCRALIHWAVNRMGSRNCVGRIQSFLKVNRHKNHL